MPRKPLSTTVADLIKAGLIKAPTQASIDYAGRLLRANLGADGQFEVGGKKYRSPSAAAGYAIASGLNRRTANREYLSVNGWKLWRVRDASGKERFLRDIRADLEESRTAR